MRSMFMKSILGFTLIELMIVVVVIATLVSIGYPSYIEFITRARRSDGQAVLMDAAARQERFFFNSNTYTTDTGVLGFSTPAASPDGHYVLSVIDADQDSYTLRATPAGEQASHDSQCGYLELTSQGVKGSETDWERCWD